MRYDTTWKGVVAERGLYGNGLEDFGNSYYNDHHYHWGYFIQVSDVLFRIDPFFLLFDGSRFFLLFSMGS
jgi:endo-1,3(4)-beta-glucanase